MEIQNLERRNSEFALTESQRELESQRQQLLEANQYADQIQRERIDVCSRLGMQDRRIKKTLLSRGNTEKKKRRLEEFLTQHNQESRTVSLFFYDLDLLSSNDIPTFLIKLLLPRVQESLAANLECREIHERISVFLETF